MTKVKTGDEKEKTAWTPLRDLILNFQTVTDYLSSVAYIRIKKNIDRNKSNGI